MKTFKVAVLMPVYNGEKFVTKQIESIINQKNVLPTIFISIDESSDNSVKIIEGLVKKYKQVKIFSKNIKHGSPTKNYFHLISNFESDNFDYVSLSDQDDVWYPEKLMRSTKILDKGDYSIYSSSVNAKIGTKIKFIDKSAAKTKFDYYFESAGPGSTYVFNKNFFKIFQKYLRNHKDNLSNFEHYDWLIYAYARENQFQWYIDKIPTLDYIQHNNNFTGANVGIKSFFKRFKEVANGDALKKANNLKNILQLKKIGIEDFHSFQSNLKLFILSFSLRRSFISKIFILFYFLILIFIGKNTEKKKVLSFQYLINYIILVSFFIFFFANSSQELFNSIKLNIENSFYIFLSSFLSLFIISYRIILTCNFFSNQKINFFFWHKNFCESQIMNYLFPFSGILYRGYLLKKLTSLSYTYYVKILIFLNILEIFLISSLVLILSFNFFGFHILYKIFLFLFLASCFYIIFSKNFNLFNIDFFSKFKKLKDHFKKDSSRLDFSQISKITLATILKIVFNYFVFFSIFYFLNIKISYFEVLVLTLINQLFEPIKITPQNIGITEAAFALFFSTISNEPIIGSYIKIIHRGFEIINYFVYFIFYKAINLFK